MNNLIGNNSAIDRFKVPGLNKPQITLQEAIKEKLASKRDETINKLGEFINAQCYNETQEKFLIDYLFGPVDGYSSITFFDKASSNLDLPRLSYNFITVCLGVFKDYFSSLESVSDTIQTVDDILNLKMQLEKTFNEHYYSGGFFAYTNNPAAIEQPIKDITKIVNDQFSMPTFKNINNIQGLYY